VGIGISGIGFFGGDAAGLGDGVGEGEIVDGLLGGILCPSCCDSALSPSDKDKTRRTDQNPCLYFRNTLLMAAPA